MIPRKLAARVRRLARQFPAVLILGPRQCGKTTLARNARSSLESPGSQYYFRRTHSGEEVDLVVDSGRQRTGYEIKCSLSVNRSDLVPLEKALADGIIHHGFVLTMGHRRHQPAAGITVLPAALLGMPKAFPTASGRGR